MQSVIVNGDDIELLADGRLALYQHYPHDSQLYDASTVPPRLVPLNDNAQSNHYGVTIFRLIPGGSYFCFTPTSVESGSAVTPCEAPSGTEVMMLVSGAADPHAPTQIPASHWVDELPSGTTEAKRRAAVANYNSLNPALKLTPAMREEVVSQLWNSFLDRACDAARQPSGVSASDANPLLHSSDRMELQREFYGLSPEWMQKYLFFHGINLNTKTIDFGKLCERWGYILEADVLHIYSASPNDQLCRGTAYIDYRSPVHTFDVLRNPLKLVHTLVEKNILTLGNTITIEPTSRKPSAEPTCLGFFPKDPSDVPPPPPPTPPPKPQDANEVNHNHLSMPQGLSDHGIAPQQMMAPQHHGPMGHHQHPHHLTPQQHYAQMHPPQHQPHYQPLPHQQHHHAPQPQQPQQHLQGHMGRGGMPSGHHYPQHHHHNPNAVPYPGQPSFRGGPMRHSTSPTTPGQGVGPGGGVSGGNTPTHPRAMMGVGGARRGGPLGPSGAAPPTVGGGPVGMTSTPMAGRSNSGGTSPVNGGSNFSIPLPRSSTGTTPTSPHPSGSGQVMHNTTNNINNSGMLRPGMGSNSEKGTTFFVFHVYEHTAEACVSDGSYFIPSNSKRHLQDAFAQGDVYAFFVWRDADTRINTLFGYGQCAVNKSNNTNVHITWRKHSINWRHADIPPELVGAECNILTCHDAFKIPQHLNGVCRHLADQIMNK